MTSAFTTEFLKLPHQEATTLSAQFGDESIPLADFSHLPTRAKFIAFMPQWDFLDFVSHAAAKYPNFRLIMQASVDGLIETQGQIAGVTARTPQGPLEIRGGVDDRRRRPPFDSARQSRLRTGRYRRADGHSLVQTHAARQRPVAASGPSRSRKVLHHDRPRRSLAMWLCHSQRRFEALKAQDIAVLCENVASLAPFAGDRVNELTGWDSVSLLSVAVEPLAGLA
ncbi:MAG: hypothetical protein WDN29_05500 [Methylovirgula sp.]